MLLRFYRIRRRSYNLGGLSKMIRVARGFGIMFSLLLILGSECCRHSTEPPPPSGPDTTSHDFVWTTYEFGEGSQSILWDAAIVGDTLAYAVGEIYLKDSTGKIDPNLYNLAKWNGTNWTLERVTVDFRGSQITLPLYGIFAFSSQDLWNVGSLPIHGDGTTWTIYDLRAIPGLDSISVEKGWGVSSRDIYFAGYRGSLVHFDGNSWQKIESGTTTDLQDVWGTSDGKTVWTCGSTPDGFHSVLLKYENGNCRTLWTRDGVIAASPFGYDVGSVWRSSSTYVTSDHGIYRLDNDTTNIKAMGGYPGFFTRMRGNADNDIVAIGRTSIIWHYNGSSWKQVLSGSQTQFFESCSMKGNTIMVVGYDSGSFPSRAIIFVGRRQ